MKYGESILKNIKEPYRSSVYQPLLMLENEVLNVFNWLITTEQMVDRWGDLAFRADAYFEGEILLGVIFNNYGQALTEQHEYDKAAVYFNKALQVLKDHEKEAVGHILTALANLAQLNIIQGDVGTFNVHFTEITRLRKKYKSQTDVTFPLTCQVLALAHQSAKNYSAAIALYVMAVNMHNELPDDKKNDLNLVMYLNNLSVCYLLNNNTEEAEKTIVYAVKILEKIQSNDSKHFVAVVLTMLTITENKGDETTAKQLKKTLKDLGINLE